jgi:hypothetical protein
MIEQVLKALSSQYFIGMAICVIAIVPINGIAQSTTHDDIWQIECKAYPETRIRWEFEVSSNEVEACIAIGDTRKTCLTGQSAERDFRSGTQVGRDSDSWLLQRNTKVVRDDGVEFRDRFILLDNGSIAAEHLALGSSDLGFHFSDWNGRCVLKNKQDVMSRISVDINVSESLAVMADPRIDATVKRIFEKIQSDDPEFAAELESSAASQQVNVGDSIGAASELIYGRYGPRSSEGSLNAWLDNMLDDFRRVRDKYPQLCNGYMNGSPDVLAQLYSNLFTVEDKLEEVQIIESIVLSAIDDPKEISNFDAVQSIFDELLNTAEDWAEAHDDLKACDLTIKIFSLAQDMDPSETADLMRFNFTY